MELHTVLAIAIPIIGCINFCAGYCFGKAKSSMQNYEKFIQRNMPTQSSKKDDKN